MSLKCFLFQHDYMFLGHTEPKDIDHIEMHYSCKNCKKSKIDSYRSDHPFVDKEYEWWIHTPLKDINHD